MDFSPKYSLPLYCIVLIMFPLVLCSNVPPSALSSSPEKSGVNSPILRSLNRNFTLEWIPFSENEFKLAVLFLPGTVGSPQVWTANRNRPVSSSATLELLPSGNLELKDGSSELIWSTNSTNGRDLNLLDSGNLVLISATGELVWQSFDHPTDALLPGQTIRTGQRVIASQSLLDSREGIYAVEMVTGGLIMYVDSDNESWPYHVVGFSQNDERNTVESVLNPACKGTRLTISEGGGEAIFQQEDEGPFCNRSFRVPVGSTDSNRDLLKFFRLDSDGNFRTYLYRVHYGWGIDQEVFSGSTACSLPNRCGHFGVCSALGTCGCPPDGRSFQPNQPGLPIGCHRINEPVCDSHDNQLLELTGVDYFVNRFMNQSLSTLADCKRVCLDNCNCTAAFYDEVLGMCFSYDSVMSLRLVGESSLKAFIKVGRSKALGGQLARGSLPKQLLAGIIVGVVLAFAGLVSLVVFFVKIRKRVLELNDDEAFLETLPGLPYRFSYKELDKATGGFKHRLGVGGFGSVYEGCLLDGSKVAVKRLESARQGHKEFHAEVAALGSISHLNLVRLRGFCVRNCDRLLVYEYLPNQSLEKWLFEKPGDTTSTATGECEKGLDWPTRYKIAVDTARGLAFLHEESRERIIHLDVKPQNILLDVDFTAKLSDFGLSKLIDRQQNDVITNMKGTPGYLAPEWLLGAAVTSKSDVYSYGMVLLELVSGRRNLDLARDTLWYFPAWAVLKVELHGSMEEVVDPRLRPSVTSDSLTWSSLVRVLKVAFWCIQEDPNMRPSMTNVLHMLEGLADVEVPPSLLQFAVRTMNNKTVIDSFQQQQSDSSVDLSNWVLSAPR